MTYFQILAEENKQLTRKPFKIIALIAFVLTCTYGLWQGADFYAKRQIALERVELNNQQQRDQAIEWYNKGIKGPESKPWVNIEKPFWAIWYAALHEMDKPKPISILSTGQAEQFAFYTQVGVWSTAYDLDLIAEIHNPEFIGVGALDFTFVWLFLLPILMIILLYDVKGLEYDLGLLKSIELHVSNQYKWILARVSYYVLLVTSILIITTLASLTISEASLENVIVFFAYSYLYCLIWFGIFFLIIVLGKGQTDQAIKMLLVWLSFAVLIPGAIHQYLNFKYPPNYMLEWVTTMREGSDEILSLSLTESKKRLSEYPIIKKSNLELDKADESHLSSLNRLLWSLEMQNVANNISAELENKNEEIKRLSLFSPILLFQNQLNNLCGTDYYANQLFRQNIQRTALKINQAVLKDQLTNTVVDEKRFKQYLEIVN